MKLRLITSVAVALALLATATARAASDEQLAAQVIDLQAKVTAMEAAQAARTAEVGATVDAVLRDADARSQFLAAGAGGAVGHGAIAPGLPEYGFSLVSGDFTLSISVGAQIRYVLNYGRERKNGSGDTETGFELARTRLTLQGSAWDPKLTYYVQWIAGDLTGGMQLLDAIVSYELSDQFTVRAGKMKAAFAHEVAMGAFEQMETSRSLTNGLIGVPDGINGRTYGAGLWYGGMNDPLHALVVYHNGCGSALSNFQHPGLNFAVSPEVCYKVMGDWRDYWEMTARRTQKDLLVLELGGDATQGDNYNDYRFVGDAMYKTASHLSLFAAFQGLLHKPRNTADNSNVFDWGFHVQAGYAVSSQIEPFARYSYVRFDNETAVGRKTFHEVTAGVNYYLGKDGSAGNNAKATLELTWLPKGSPAAVAYNDILGGSDKTELILRAQLQFRP